MSDEIRQFWLRWLSKSGRNWSNPQAQAWREMDGQPRLSNRGRTKYTVYLTGTLVAEGLAEVQYASNNRISLARLTPAGLAEAARDTPAEDTAETKERVLWALEGKIKMNAVFRDHWKRELSKRDEDISIIGTLSPREKREYAERELAKHTDAITDLRQLMTRLEADELDPWQVLEIAGIDLDDRYTKTPETLDDYKRDLPIYIDSMKSKIPEMRERIQEEQSQSEQLKMRLRQDLIDYYNREIKNTQSDIRKAQRLLREISDGKLTARQVYRRAVGLMYYHSSPASWRPGY